MDGSTQIALNTNWICPELNIYRVSSTNPTKIREVIIYTMKTNLIFGIEMHRYKLSVYVK